MNCPLMPSLRQSEIGMSSRSGTTGSPTTATTAIPPGVHPRTHTRDAHEVGKIVADRDEEAVHERIAMRSSREPQHVFRL